MVTRTQLSYLDWGLIILLIVNSMIGVAAIYSSSSHLVGDYPIKQIMWLLIGLGAIFILISFDYHILVTYSPYLYIVCIILLISTQVFGHLSGGAKSWIKLPFFQIQASEITKIALILFLSKIFSEFKGRLINLPTGLTSLVVISIPFIIVAVQPDLGTAASYLFIFSGAVLLAGVNKKILVFILIIAIVFGFLGWSFFLKDYQRARVKTLLFPKEDPLGVGYHIIQSKIAIGSGGLLGKGYLRGTQSQLRFLPARHTDFIFSVIGEEFGFMGVMVVLVFYFFFLARIFKSVGKARDRAGVYIIFMVAVMLSFQFLINVLMTIGLFPIAGVPLPFISYGGSSLLTNSLAVGLVLNIKMRRFVNL
ncbi:MAG: rod shape-determining protein RodA [Candidatus Aminicenantes bacterium]|nr:rod shape-determining protein RodA [Candidatus Aminicenantes bacterium]